MTAGGEYRISQTTFLIVVWGGVVVPLVFMLFRVYARIKTFRRLFFDDAFVLLAWLMLLVQAILFTAEGHFMYEVLAVGSGDIFPPPPDFFDHVLRYARMSVGVLICFYTGLWAVKFSFLLFFRRLGERVAGQNILWWCVSGFTFLALFGVIGTIPYPCLLGSFEEISNPTCTSPEFVARLRQLLWFTCAMDVATDAMIILLPFVLLWKVQIDIRQKLALVGIFSLAVITMAFSFVRGIVVSSEDLQVTWFYSWSCVEHAIAVIVVCLASFRALFRRKGQCSQYTTPPNQRFTRNSDGSKSVDFKKLKELTPQPTDDGTPSIADEEYALVERGTDPGHKSHV